MSVRGLALRAVVSLCAVLGVLSLWGGVALALPDGRAWELVSPPDKHGAGIEAPGSGGSNVGLVQAAADGSALAYFASAPVFAEPTSNTVFEKSPVLSVRGVGGWSSQDVSTAHEAVIGTGGGLTVSGSEYQLFSPDLSVGLLGPAGSTPLPPLPEGAERTPYLRDSASGGYVPLLSAANVPPGTEFGGSRVKVAGASLDLSHVVLRSSAPLTSDAAGVEGEALYEWAGGQLRLVSVLPASQGAAAVAGVLGYNSSGANVRHAVSDDGSRVVWSSGGGLYMRDMTKGETVRLDAVQGGSGGGSGGVVFQTASVNGSRVFFTDGQQLTANSSPGPEGGGSLYVCEMVEVAGRLTCKLTDLTVSRNGEGEVVSIQGWVFGASDDGSYVYFVASGVISEECGAPVVSGECNLYVEHYDSARGLWEQPRPIAPISGNDVGDFQHAPNGLTDVTVRVSPDGRYLAFMSENSLTGYDNRDVSSGEHDQEVFLFDASTGRVVCASCNPAGARPAGILDVQEANERAGLLVDLQAQVWGGHWLAGSLPGWINAVPVGPELDLYQPRYLSDSGRLFFNSPDALVPGDVNGKEDVYEYEPVGVSDCQNTPGSTSVVFSEAAGGCVGLIASGTSSDESAFLDASESGGDTFFVTSAQLTSQDVDGAYDAYDAHECTSVSPCPAPADVSLPPCGSGDACRGALASPQVVFGAPGSASFAGAGNVPSGPVSTSPVARKSLTRAQKLARALAVCKRKPKRKRAACKRQARRLLDAISVRAGKSLPAVTRTGR